MSIYLDYNASTPVDKRVLDVMTDVYKNSYGNADSRTHDFGDNARKIVENSRSLVADLLGVKKDEVFFTSGATESNNIAILGLQKYAFECGKRHIITTSIEHKAVLEPTSYLSEKGFEITYINPDKSGRINAEKVLDKVRDDTLLVSVMHVNNETGIIQPVDLIGEKLNKIGVLFHIDAAQSFGKLVDELKSVKYDMLSASAHKMYGPQGIGTLVLRKKRYKLPPVSAIMFGGSQEHGLRPGTLPTALIAGFGEACRIALADYKSNETAYKHNKNIIMSMLSKSGVEYEINGNCDYCIPNTINVSFKGVNSEALMLATKHYCGISNGSACNSRNYESSHVLETMGFDINRIQSAVRISWGCDNIMAEDIENLINAVKKMV
ncbi:MAG: aminotransferase class V-fold PLP-dependent enzyme [Ruminococcus sp.]|nr:aminotransferase class V-fold PLP-dependent enzyme [Ruminococcus sp.]